MDKLRKILLSVLLFSCAALCAGAKPKTELRVVIIEGESAVMDETFDIRREEISFTKRVFGFDAKKSLSRIIGDGKSEKEAFARIYDGLTAKIDKLAAGYYREAASAEAEFFPDREEKFSYKRESVGRRVNEEELYRGLYDSLRKNVATAEIKFLITKPEITCEELKNNTVLRARFSTYYGKSGEARRNNVELAVKYLNGARIKSGEVFSFNERVGRRTEERGFTEAPVIVDGKYVGGVGGGVCQVSTTLYNAVLYADLDVTSVTRHSLPVHYVKPSFDAMVSAYSDFRFVNNGKYDAFINAETKDGYIIIGIYASPSECDVRLLSETTGTIPREVVYVDDETLAEGEEKVIVNGADGVCSRGIIEKYVGNECVFRKEIRKDVYKAQKRVVARGTKSNDDISINN